MPVEIKIILRFLVILFSQVLLYNEITIDSVNTETHLKRKFSLVVGDSAVACILKSAAFKSLRLNKTYGQKNMNFHLYSIKILILKFILFKTVMCLIS